MRALAKTKKKDDIELYLLFFWLKPFLFFLPIPPAKARRQLIIQKLKPEAINNSEAKAGGNGFKSKAGCN